MFATVIIFIVVIATMWYLFLYRIANTVQAAGTAIMTDMDTSSTLSGYTNSFITNLIAYFLPLALIGLTIWVYVHAQKPQSYGG